MIKHSIAAMLLLVAPIAFADSFTFSLLPSDGQVSGPAGSTVGWGYSITNQSSTNWLVTSGLNSDSFFFGTPLAIFDFPDLAPGTTVSVPFDAIAGTGLYQFIWDASAPDDFTNFGHFVLSAEWWSGDPFNDGSFIQTAPDSSQAYFATVASPESTVPEPQSFVLLGTAIIGMFIFRKRSTLLM